MPSPEAICAQVRAALEHEPRINLHRYPIHLHCEDGIVTVDGEAEHIVAKKLALELAAAIPGVDGLVDRLRVVPTRPMGDGSIRDHVRDALLQEPAFATFAITLREKGQVDTVRPASGTPFGAIEVAIAEGVVTLNGQVPSLSHQRLGGVLAWWVPGSRDVINGLAVWATTSTGCRLGADRAGAPRRRAEAIGRWVAEVLLADLATGATVDRHLADQVVLFAAVAEGTSHYRVPSQTAHVQSNLWLVSQFGVQGRGRAPQVAIEGLGVCR